MNTVGWLLDKIIELEPVIDRMNLVRTARTYRLSDVVAKFSIHRTYVGSKDEHLYGRVEYQGFKDGRSFETSTFHECYACIPNEEEWIKSPEPAPYDLFSRPKCRNT